MWFLVGNKMNCQVSSQDLRSMFLYPSIVPTLKSSRVLNVCFCVYCAIHFCTRGRKLCPWPRVTSLLLLAMMESFPSIDGLLEVRLDKNWNQNNDAKNNVGTWIEMCPRFSGHSTCKVSWNTRYLFCLLSPRLIIEHQALKGTLLFPSSLCLSCTTACVCVWVCRR